MPPFISELKDFIAGNLVIDCTNMQLASNEPNGTVYSGPGSITQLHEGILHLKLHCSRRIDFENLPQRLRASYSNAGEIIPAETFFTLEARDIDSNLWTAENVLPSASSGSEGAVLTADLSQLSTQRKIDSFISKPALILGFPQSVDFPSNVHARTVQIVEGEEYSSQLDLNRASFQACNYKFELEKLEERWFFAHAQALEADVPLGALDLRVSEALQFALSRRVVWSLCEIWEGNAIRGYLRPFRIFPEPTFPKPPVGFDVIDREDFVWNLFERYFNHVIDYEREGHYHPISALVASVVSASASALENYALVTSTAVEGILNLEFPNTGALVGDERDRLSQQIQAAVELIEAEPQFQDEFKRRVCHWLRSSLLNPRAKDKLYHLVENGEIEERLFETWNEIRNRAAHARLFSGSGYEHSNRTRRLYKWCHEVYHLFNQLVFLAIGYDGPYTDYSTVGWPMKIPQEMNSGANE